MRFPPACIFLFLSKKKVYWWIKEKWTLITWKRVQVTDWWGGDLQQLTNKIQVKSSHVFFFFFFFFWGKSRFFFSELCVMASCILGTYSLYYCIFHVYSFFYMNNITVRKTVLYTTFKFKMTIYYLNLDNCKIYGIMKNVNSCIAGLYPDTMDCYHWLTGETCMAINWGPPAF
jgi:hypothetical protein